MSVRKAKPTTEAENEQNFVKAREECRRKAKALFYRRRGQAPQIARLAGIWADGLRPARLAPQ